MKLEKYVGNPVLSPNPKQPWESLVVCNPSVINDKGTFHILYRAAGNNPEHLIYHGVDAKCAYHIGATMLDLQDPRKVIARAAPESIMLSKAGYEWQRLYPDDTVFPTVNVVLDGKLFDYYGCADKFIGVTTAKFDHLVDYVLQFKS